MDWSISRPVTFVRFAASGSIGIRDRIICYGMELSSSSFFFFLFLFFFFQRGSIRVLAKDFG